MILRMEGQIEDWMDEMMLGLAALTASLLHCFRETRPLVARVFTEAWVGWHQACGHDDAGTQL